MTGGSTAATDDGRRVTIGRTATGAAIAADEGSTMGATIDATGILGDVTIAVTTGKGTTMKVETTGADSIVLLRCIGWSTVWSRIWLLRVKGERFEVITEAIATGFHGIGWRHFSLLDEAFKYCNIAV